MGKVAGENNKSEKQRGKLRYDASDQAKEDTTKQPKRNLTEYQKKQMEVAEKMEGKKKDRPIKKNMLEELNDLVKAEKLYKKQGVPKGANPATHERCVKEVKAKGHSKSSAYAICNAAGAGMKKSLENKGESMKKSREELVSEFTEKVKSGEMTVEDVEKALKAGYEASAESYDDNVEDIEVAKQSSEKAEVEVSEDKEENKEAQFAEGLFQPISLGSTLRQGSTGNVMANVKKPAMDYVDAYKHSIKQTTIKKPSN